jgi:hypothetical protein
MSDDKLSQETTSAITKQIEVGETGMVLKTAEEAINFARWNFESGLLPEHIHNTKQAFAIMARGAELGLKPHASWRWLYMTKGGKIAMETKGKLAVCQASPSFLGYKEWIENEEEPPEKWVAVASARRRNRDDTIKEFSFKDAERAGLTRQKRNRKGELYDGPWQGYLKDMLLARARDRCLDLAFADVLGGMPSKEIMEEVEEKQIREIRGVSPAQAKAKDPMLDIVTGKKPAPAEPETVEAEVVEKGEEPVAPYCPSCGAPYKCEKRKGRCDACGHDVDVDDAGELPEYQGEVKEMPEEPPEPEGINPTVQQCNGCGVLYHLDREGCPECGVPSGGHPGEPPPPDERDADEAEAKHRRGKMKAVKVGDTLPDGRVVEEVDEKGQPLVVTKAPEKDENPFERGKRKAREAKKGQKSLIDKE